MKFTKYNIKIKKTSRDLTYSDEPIIEYQELRVERTYPNRDEIEGYDVNGKWICTYTWGLYRDLIESGRSESPWSTNVWEEISNEEWEWAKIK